MREKPDTVNGEPYGKGWMIRIRMKAPDELGQLMNFEEYRQHTQG